MLCYVKRSWLDLLRTSVHFAGPVGPGNMHWAVRVEGTTAVHLLLTHGANVNAKDEEASTPLMVAATLGRDDVMKLLLKAEGPSRWHASRGTWM